MMVMQRQASFVLRPRRWKVALVPMLVVLTVAGCSHHKRASLRPVYVTPAPACSTPGCASETVVPAPTTSTPSSVTPSVVQPSVPSLVEPSASTLGAPAEPAPPSSSSPANERIPSAVPGPPLQGSGSSTRPSGVDEPGLIEPITPNPSTNGTGTGTGTGNNRSGGTQSPSSLTVPRLQPPGTSLNGGRRAVPTRLLRTSLREQLMPYTNNPDDLFAPPKADRPWKYVVLHHSASASGSYGAIDREHRKRLGWDGCGYHFVIGNGTGSPDGQIEVAQRWSDQKHGIHCRNGRNPDVSEYGIGICLVGNLDDAPPTPRQIAAAQALVAYLGARYRIPAEHIGTHAQLASTATACPGKHFPAQAILGSNSHMVQR